MDTQDYTFSIKSIGGISYGYDVVKKLDANGKLIRGDPTINIFEVKTVRGIFKNYLTGKSPKSIAQILNEEGVKVPPPMVGTSMIYCNRERGKGVINNELYIGRIIWKRMRY